MNEDISDALAELETESITWNGEAFSCNAGDAKKSAALDIGGFEVSSDLQVVVRVSLFSGARPQRGQTLTYNATRYRIESVNTAGNGALVLDCAHDAKGA